MIACLGGWCGSRESCANYVHGDKTNPTPSERLCRGLKEDVTPIKGGSEPVAAPCETVTGSSLSSHGVRTASGRVTSL